MTDKILPLIAKRHALGLNITELAELPNIEQDKRVIANYERGDRKPARSYNESMYIISLHYSLLLKLLNQDIDAFNIAHPLPVTDDTSEYIELLKTTERLTLPYFKDFELFTATTSNTSQTSWRVWQAVVSHLVMIGKVTRLDDHDLSSLIGFGNTQYWLDGGYNTKD